jgi:hypothetical protein
MTHASPFVAELEVHIATVSPRHLALTATSGSNWPMPGAAALHELVAASLVASVSEPPAHEAAAQDFVQHESRLNRTSSSWPTACARAGRRRRARSVIPPGSWWHPAQNTRASNISPRAVQLDGTVEITLSRLLPGDLGVYNRQCSSNPSSAPCLGLA